MTIKGFKAARAKVIDALINGDYAHDGRDAEKDYLAAGRVSPIEVISLLKLCNGLQYIATAHHQEPCDVHIFKPVQQGVRWYIKIYFLSDVAPLDEDDTDTMFISVHPSESE